MTGSVGLFLRDDKLYAIPQGGHGGVYYGIEPIQVVPLTAAAMTHAIRAALADSARTAGQPMPDLKKRRAPRLALGSIRSYKDLYRGAAHAFLYADGSNLMLIPHRPATDGRGFEGISDPIPLVNDETIGAQVLTMLKSLPRAPEK